MSIVAAFHWNKSPRTYISTMIFDKDSMQMLSPPKIEFFAKSYWRFRSQVKQSIKAFFMEIVKAHKEFKRPVKIEYKILAEVNDIPYMIPARESKLVRKVFLSWVKKLKKHIRKLKVGSQLRSKLTGKALRLFKAELKSLHLVRRKRDTGYEYHLWTVALHATPATYQQKVDRMRKIIIDNIFAEVA